MRFVWVGIGLAALVGGCSAEIGEATDQADVDGAVATPDADPGGPAIDAPAADDTPDAALPPPDAAPTGPDASLDELCTAGYGDVPGYELCSTVGGACSFIALNEMTSCAQHCAARGGTCVTALDNEVGFCDQFEPNQDGISCTSVGKQDLLCTCTVP